MKDLEKQTTPTMPKQTSKGRQKADPCQARRTQSGKRAPTDRCVTAEIQACRGHERLGSGRQPLASPLADTSPKSTEPAGASRWQGIRSQGCSCARSDPGPQRIEPLRASRPSLPHQHQVADRSLNLSHIEGGEACMRCTALLRRPPRAPRRAHD